MGGNAEMEGSGKTGWKPYICKLLCCLQLCLMDVTTSSSRWWDTEKARETERTWMHEACHRHGSQQQRCAIWGELNAKDNRKNEKLENLRYVWFSFFPPIVFRRFMPWVTVVSRSRKQPNFSVWRRVAACHRHVILSPWNDSRNKLKETFFGWEFSTCCVTVASCCVNGTATDAGLTVMIPEIMGPHTLWVLKTQCGAPCKLWEITRKVDYKGNCCRRVLRSQREDVSR